MKVILLLAALVAAAPSCAADSVLDGTNLGPIQDAIKKQKADQQKRMTSTVPSAHYTSQVSIGDPWTDATRQRVYGWDGPPSQFMAIGGTLNYETPFPVTHILAPFVDPFSKQDTERIANQCKASFTEWWDRIGCVSKQVHSFYKDFKFDGLRSFCRSHTQAFNVSFLALGLNRSWSRSAEASGPKGSEHVANAVIITDDHGLTFSYVIDSGWFPGKLFPQNTYAIRRHDRDGDGKTDFFELPKISAAPSYEFRSR